MNEAALPDRFAARMGQLLGPGFPGRIALAVSGGGDSMAMLALCHGWARHMGIAMEVVTVDHGLREGSADEAAMVARECAALGHPHRTLRWHWDGQGNLQDAARRARLGLIGDWAGDAVDHVLFAHSRDDVAETLLMRLERGSGVDGLSAMAPLRRVSVGGGSFWQVRPLLDERRSDLRRHAETLGMPIADDPSNADPRFGRVRVRKAMEALGLDVDALAETAARMTRARAALEARTDDVASRIAREGTALGLPTGIVEIDRDGLSQVERETQLRLLARAIGWVGGAEYRPRASALEEVLDRALGGAGATLQGAQVIVLRDVLCVLREARAVAGHDCVAGRGAWDGRWHLRGALIEGLSVRALGEGGWRQVGERPQGAPPHALALSLPAVFEGDRLVACRHLGHGPAHEIRLVPPRGPFVAGPNPH
ncbi:tRNA lysidine(34) synthetase TilS [Roseibacterium sp. SDUM158017]|uniref:tRNA lysidine(34) synthetase TilS n=1 Tax=Roseicyclus salinarum TaxID=3036773 RepID=UPI0024155669|nr:tRNA lysidine(34) synthetase TilS [Roseibacterium sp. SDUM158017]MDG4648225.1 tRNA lysidine(34) synthetase TilS [Roseibacterium sp. SDUM158017]